MPARSSSKRRRGSKRKERDGTGRALDVYTSEYRLDVDLSLTCNAEVIWYNSGEMFLQRAGELGGRNPNAAEPKKRKGRASNKR